MSYLNGKKYLMKIFVVELKFVLIELKIFWYHEEKVISWKNILLSTNSFWLNKNIFWYDENKLI